MIRNQSYSQIKFKLIQKLILKIKIIEFNPQQMSLGPVHPQSTSYSSVSMRRDALWNVVEPGDPYDIRKSMIAKVPGDKKNFMGDYLEIVCLFQAAEIERLCEFLDDFKLKYRQIQRRELDRHSYEIQIKQLNHKLAEQSEFREENQKLREFIKNLTNNKQEVEDTVRSKYQRLLIQSKSVEDENARMRRENQYLAGQIANFEARFQALRKSKQAEIEEMYSRLNQQSTTSSQFQINSIRSQYESQIQRLDLENKRIKQQNEDYSRQVESWQEKYRMLEKELFKRPADNDTQRLERQIAEYENRFVIFGQQIDRLNLVVREITGKFEMSQQRNRDYEQKLQTANRELTMIQNRSSSGSQQSQQLLRRISELEMENRRLQESGRYLEESETRLRAANDEIMRLTNQVRLQVETTSRLKNDLLKFQYEGSKVNILEKELYEAKQLAAENNALKLRIAEDENKIAIMRQEIQRLREEIFKKGGIDTNYQTLVSEYQKLQRHAEDLQMNNQTIIQEYETRMTQRVTQYESRIQMITRTKGSELQSTASLLQSEVQRLGEMLKRRNEEMELVQRQLREVKSLSSQSEMEVARKMQNYESVIQGLKRQNQEVIKRIRELQTFQRRSSEYENKVLIISQEVERLNHQLRNKDIDIENLKIKLRDQQIAIVQKYEMDTSRKLGTYEMNLNNIARENQELKRKNAELENKGALLSQEIQRLTSKMRQNQQITSQYEQQIQRLQRVARQTEVNLTNKYGSELNQRIANYESVIKNLQAENEEMRKRIMDLQNSNKKLVEYERTLQQMSRQLQRLAGALKQKQEESMHHENNNKNLARQMQDMMRKYNELQNTVRNKYEVQASRTITSLEQNITVLSRQNNQLKRYIEDYENRFKAQNQDIEKFNVNLRNLSQQNQVLKRQIQEIQTSFKSKIDVEVTGKYRSYESTIESVKMDLENLLRENNELKRVLQVTEQNNIKLNQENENLRKKFHLEFEDLGRKFSEYETRISQLQNENEGLKRVKGEMQVSIRQYEMQASRKISSLDQNFGNASRQNDELRRKLEQLSRQFEEARRLIQKLQRDNEQLARRLREFGDVNRKVVEYENKISLLAQEHERVIASFKIKAEQLTNAEQYINELSSKLQHSQQNMNRSQSSIQQYESEVKSRMTQYEQNISTLKQENAELKNRLSMLNEMNVKIAEYQNKIVILKQELERINDNLRSQLQKTNQYENALRQAGAENQQLVRKFNQMQATITQRYEVQATRNIRQLEQSIEAAQKENQRLVNVLHDYEQKLNAQNVEMQRLTVHLGNITEENNQLKTQVKETEMYFTRKYETEVTTKYTAFERDITNYQRQIDDLMKKLTEYADRVVPQYEMQTVTLRQQIERMNQHFGQQNSKLVSNLNALVQENQALKKQIVQTKQSITQKYQIEVNQKITYFEQNITVLKKQNQDLKKYIQEFGGHYEGLGQNFTVLQRQNQSLRKSLEEAYQKYENEVNKAGSFEQNLTGLGRENEELKRKLIEMQHEMERLIRKLNELSQQNETIRRQGKQNQIQLTQSWETKFKQQGSLQSQKYQRQIEDLKRHLNEVGGDASRRIATLEEQLKRYAGELQKRNVMIQEYDSRIRQLTGQNDALKRQVRETEISISQRWQTEFRSKINVYEQQILSMNTTVQQREKEIYETNNKRIMELESKTALLSQQLQRLNQILRAKSQQNEKMRQEIERLNNTLRLKLEETRQLEGEHNKLRSVTQTEFMQLQTAYNLIVKENENYKNNLFQYENSIQKLYAEFERLQKIISDFKNQRESLFEKNYGLSNQIERLNAEIKRLEIQVEEVRLRLSDQSALHKRINEHMALFVVLFAEIESLRKRVKDKEKQMEDVRRSSLAPFKIENRARGESS